MLAVIAALKDIQPKPQDPLAVLQQAKNLFAPASESERSNDQIEQLDRVLEFAQKLAALRAGAGDRSGWDIGLDYGKELAIPILGMIQNFMALRMHGAIPAQVAAPGMAPAVTPAAFDPYRDSARMREHARTMNAQAATAPASAGPGQSVPPGAPPNFAAQAPAQPNEVMQLLSAYGGLVINALNNGTRGCDFAEWLSRGFGTATHATIVGVGEDALTQSMLSVPELAIFGEARLRKFSYEFIHYEEILDAEEETDDEETAAAASKG
jgi:hypothetical protein